MQAWAKEQKTGLSMLQLMADPKVRTRCIVKEWAQIGVLQMKTAKILLLTTRLSLHIGHWLNKLVITLPFFWIDSFVLLIHSFNAHTHVHTHIQGDLTKALDLELTHPGPTEGVGLWGRCKRHAIYAVNGEIKAINIAESEDDPAGDDFPESTLADAMLEVIRGVKAARK